MMNVQNLDSEEIFFLKESTLIRGMRRIIFKALVCDINKSGCFESEVKS